MHQIRRNVLLGAGGALAGAALVAPAALAGAKDEVALLTTYVAGTAYHAAEAAAALRPGAPLELKREHANDYDPRAIAVRTRSGAKLGYLPRVDNHALARLMDTGFELAARVREVRPDARQPDIRLDVFLAV